jgi:4-amino-4-deoxy-L-arabinose transferase-like glycosyltransferase
VRTKRLANKHIVGVLALLSFILVQGLFLISRDSPTYDEPNHIASGYSYLMTGDLKMSLAQPPLTNMLVAAPLLVMKPALPIQNESWKQADDWTFAREFLFHSGNDANSIVFWARVPVLLLSIVLGAFVFLWSRELFGIHAAYFSLALYAFCPNLLAHGRLATTDMPLACFAFISSFYFWKLLENPTVKNTVASGIFLGLALSSKYSSILFVVSFLLVAIVWGWRLEGKSSGRQAGEGETKKIEGGAAAAIRGLSALQSWKAHIHRGSFRSIVGRSVAVVLIGSVIALLSSGLTMKPVLSYTAVQGKIAQFGERQVFMFQNERMRQIAYKLASTVPLPRYFVGLLFNHFHFKRGHFAYLAGKWKLGGWWYYFPIAFLLKVPVPLLILLCVWFYARLRSPSRFSSAELILVCIPVVWLLWSIALVRLKIVLRHILFVLPFFHVLLGKLVSPPLEAIPVPENGSESGAQPAAEATTHTSVEADTYTIARSSSMPNVELKTQSGTRAGASVSSALSGLFRIRTLFPLLLLVWYCFESILIFPHDLAYFNELAGGPKGGVNWLVDSNLDWGQDLKRLKSYVDKHRIESLKLFYFGMADPAYYGIKSKPLTLEDFRNLEASDSGEAYQNEKWALSVTDYAVLLRTAPWLKKIQGLEDARIGYSIFVFDPSRLKSVLFPEMVLEARLGQAGQ